MKRLNWIAVLASAVLGLMARPAEVVAQVSPQVSPASEISPALGKQSDRDCIFRAERIVFQADL